MRVKSVGLVMDNDNVSANLTWRIARNQWMVDLKLGVFDDRSRSCGLFFTSDLELTCGALVQLGIVSRFNEALRGRRESS